MTSRWTINKILLLNSWTNNLPLNPDCTICRCSNNSNSLINQDKGVDSIAVTGLCGHTFHQECIKLWIDKNNYCPNCYTKWSSA